MEKKSIILQKVPFDDMGTPLFPRNMILDAHRKTQDILGDDYVVITSPFGLTCVDGDEKIISVNCKKYSYNELTKIVKYYENR